MARPDLPMPDVPLAWALALAWATLGLVLLMVLVLLLLRVWRLWQAPRQARFVARWQPLLLGALAGDAPPAVLPALMAGERWSLLLLWLQLQLTVEGAARARLTALGRALGLTAAARARLGSRHPAERWVALLALGRLGEAQDAPPLRTCLLTAGGQSALYLVRALLELDADAHAPAVAQHLLGRKDLDLARLSVLLRPFARPLGRALLDLQPAVPDPAAPSVPEQVQDLLRWLRLAQALRLQLPLATLQPALQAGQDPELIMAALRLYQGEAGDAPVCVHAGHADWRVRVQVARALGQVGTAQAVPVLLALVTDAQWWVRYRAAQALLRLPGASHTEVLSRIAATGDRYARSMAEAVLAEQQGAA